MTIRILIIDDEADYSETVGFWLMAHGYQVRTASSAFEGLKAIEEEKPDIVFLDFLMPGMDGIETLREIRKRFVQLPVIMLTAYVTEEKLNEANKMGINGIFYKGEDLSGAAKIISGALRNIKGEFIKE